MTAAAARISVYARMEDRALEAEIARLGREVERLDDATWPSAFQQRIDYQAALDEARAEQERRHTP